MADTHAQQIETDKQAIRDGTSEPELWLKKIEAVKGNRTNEAWKKQAEHAESIYEGTCVEEIAFNVLHANGQTLLPALYNSSPAADIRRRFGDADPVGKMVVDLSERLISYSLDQYDFDSEMRACVQDSYVVGRGMLRIRYVPHMLPDDEVGYQECPVERVPWEKVILGPARSWAQMTWIAFEHDLTRDELERINPELGKTIPIGDGQHAKDDRPEEKGILRTTKVFEVWDKATKRCLFIAEKEKKRVLKAIPDPLGLPDFFPTFRPLSPSRRGSSNTPLVPYQSFRRQAEELDRITKRINALIGQLKVRGLYDSTMKADFEMVRQCEDGQFVAAGDGAAAFAGGMGLEKAIWVWPMDPTVTALSELYAQRQQVREIVDQLSGVSDILRGAVDPREKLGQSQIKQNNGSIRITDWQNDIARLARDIFRAKIAIFSKKYTDQNIQMMTGLPNTKEQQQVWPQALQMFRSPEMRSYRIDIETDSTIRADMTRNQEQMNTFLAGTAQFVQSMGEFVQTEPAAKPVIIEIYTAFARKFKLGKQAEDALDKLSQQVLQAAENPQPQPNPEAEKAKMEMGIMQQKAQMDAQASQADLQMKGQQMQMQAQSDERMMGVKERMAQMDLQIKELELQMKQREMEMKLAGMQQEQALKASGQRQQFEMDEQSRQADIEMMQESNLVKRSSMEDKAKFDKQRMAQQARARPGEQPNRSV